MRGDTDSGPWYRYFWPWFLIALVGSSVLAGLVTLWLAIDHRDSLVEEDWYRDGTAINRRLDREARARQLDLRATLRIDAGGVEVDLERRALQVENGPLRLLLSHATQSVRDRSVLLVRTAPGHFVGRVEGDLNGRWYATLEPQGATPGSARDWRLGTAFELPAAMPIHFGEGR